VRSTVRASGDIHERWPKPLSPPATGAQAHQREDGDGERYRNPELLQPHMSQLTAHVDSSELRFEYTGPAKVTVRVAPAGCS
jgi:hypothetical protein